MELLQAWLVIAAALQPSGGQQSDAVSSSVDGTKPEIDESFPPFACSEKSEVREVAVHFTNRVNRVCVSSSVDEELREEDEHSSVETNARAFVQSVDREGLCVRDIITYTSQYLAGCFWLKVADERHAEQRAKQTVSLVSVKVEIVLMIHSEQASFRLLQCLKPLTKKTKTKQRRLKHP